jgi:peptidoglycan biosynthesis protein MviN/MurJ (putative lipid II flippase)
VRTPLWAAGGAFVVNIIASLALIGPLANAGGSSVAAAIARAAAVLPIAALGQVGLALAASLAVIVNAALLIVPITRRLGGFALGPVAASLARSLIASLPMVLAVEAMVGGVEWTASGGTLTKGLWLAAIVAAGGAAFGATALLLGGPEVGVLRRALVKRR